MNYYNLGGIADDQSGDQIAIGGQEIFGIDGGFWTGTGFSVSLTWAFDFGGGNPGQNYLSPGGPEGSPGLWTWAVRDGAM